MGRRLAHVWGLRQLQGLAYAGIGIGVILVVAPVATCGGCVGTLVLGELGFVIGFAGSFAGLITLVFLGILGVGLAQSRRRAARLDALFAGIGAIAPSGGGLVHRSWEGTVGSGRTLQARLDRGPTVGLRVTAEVRTRAAFGRDSNLGRGAAGALGRQVVSVPGHDGLIGGGRELDFVRALAEADGVSSDLHALLDAPSPQLRSVSIGPGYVAVEVRYLPVDALAPDGVQAWVDALDRVAGHAESLPVSDPIEANAIERAMVEDPTALRTRVTVITLGAFGCFALFLAALGVGVFVLAITLQP